MKKIIFLNLIVASFVFTSGVALADCSGAYYGSSTCSDSGFNLSKRVSRNDSTESKEKLTGIKKVKLLNILSKSITKLMKQKL